MQRNHADRGPILTHYRRCDERLKALLLKLWNHLHPGVTHRRFTDHLRGACPSDPADQSLVDSDTQLIDERTVTRRGSSKN